MIVAESTYPVTLPGLAHLSRAVGETDFRPGILQQPVLQRAIQLLDMELRDQADKCPELVVAIRQPLNEHLD